MFPISGSRYFVYQKSIPSLPKRKSLTPEIKINLSRFTATTTATTSPPLCLLHNFLIVVSSSSPHERRRRGRFQFQSSVVCGLRQLGRRAAAVEPTTPELRSKARLEIPNSIGRSGVDVKKNVTVTISSDKGLCGGINSTSVKTGRGIYKLSSGTVCYQINSFDMTLAWFIQLNYSVKRETLKLIQTFLEKADDQAQIGKKFVPPMMDPVLGDYARNLPDARESEVLSLFATIINKYKAAMIEDVPRIFEVVF
ncbi:hypothetical protein Tsubulata_037491 [Turnera subulata]|uniref:Exportin-1 C-terminal domain-containing protein n=1 Tax=Turnera subulata TaxID=218843 RepID=A0A9Q0JR73_9ROSI|nr:hypothetical protein Tsubulata_037491 [Turnera subulata]